jgi:hypothetical protein
VDMQVCFPFIVMERRKTFYAVPFLKFVYHLFRQIVVVMADKTFRQGEIPSA